MGRKGGGGGLFGLVSFVFGMLSWIWTGAEMLEINTVDIENSASVPVPVCRPGLHLFVWHAFGLRKHLKRGLGSR